MHDSPLITLAPRDSHCTCYMKRPMSAETLIVYRFTTIPITKALKTVSSLSQQ